MGRILTLEDIFVQDAEPVGIDIEEYAFRARDLKSLVKMALARRIQIRDGFPDTQRDALWALPKGVLLNALLGDADDGDGEGIDADAAAAGAPPPGPPPGGHIAGRGRGGAARGVVADVRGRGRAGAVGGLGRGRGAIRGLGGAGHGAGRRGR